MGTNRMAIHDPISDLLTRIRNAKMAEHRFVDLNLSKMILNIVKVLKEQGFVENFLVDYQKRKIRIFFKFAKLLAIINLALTILLSSKVI